MKPMDLIKMIANEPIMTLVFEKKDGTIRKVLASRCKLMYESANEEEGQIWRGNGTPKGCFSYVDVVDNHWKRLIIDNLIAVKRSDNQVFYTSKKALKMAENVVGKL